MNYINRLIDTDLQMLPKGKVTILYGARRVGKTVAIEHSLKKIQGKKIFYGTGDDLPTRNILNSENQALINSVFSGYDIVFIDEAQRIPNIRWGLKILTDSNPHMVVIASGSSSFDLSGKLGEPLTGRNNSMRLFSFSVSEMVNQFGRMHIIQNLPNYLVYGMYPEVVSATNNTEKQSYLIELRNSYLFKDILELERIKNASKLQDLLTLIAFQIGKDVSLTELSDSLSIAKQTVERYLDLLEKSFIIVKLKAFSKNERKEISKSQRYFFLDNGIRNALVQNFNPPDARDDMGMLWENYCIVERLKKHSYAGTLSANYFWRSYSKQEVDFVEKTADSLHGYELKWNSKKKAKIPTSFATFYPSAEFSVVTPDTFFDFVL